MNRWELAIIGKEKWEEEDLLSSFGSFLVTGGREVGRKDLYSISINSPSGKLKNIKVMRARKNEEMIMM